jgi:diguanylate cyclase (GGDEF)-like protein
VARDSASRRAVDALATAERVRVAISTKRVTFDGATTFVTVSSGFVSLDDVGPNATASDLLARADARLYSAKGAGRNRVCADG